MPNKTDKSPRNASGLYYVDATCVDCDMCRESAPLSFRRDEETSLSYVFRQPVTALEIALAEEARQNCPTDSIGNDGV